MRLLRYRGQDKDRLQAQLSQTEQIVAGLVQSLSRPSVPPTDIHAQLEAQTNEMKVILLKGQIPLAYALKKLINLANGTAGLLGIRRIVMSQPSGTNIRG